LFCASYNESTIFFPASHANNSRALNKNINKNIFSAKIISIGNDIDDNRLLIFSNRDNRGDDTLEVHMFEFSNIMSWESKININNDITEELRDFMLRLKGTLSFNVKEDLGTMISDHKSSTDEAVRNISIVAF